MAKKPICVYYSCNYCGLKYTVHAINPHSISLPHVSVVGLRLADSKAAELMAVEGHLEVSTHPQPGKWE